jgi:hypothetical protein
VRLPAVGPGLFLLPGRYAPQNGVGKGASSNLVLIQYLRIDARTFPMYALNMYGGEMPCPESL